MRKFTVAEQTRKQPDLDNARRVLLLESMDGVGRVSTRKILQHFSRLEEVARFPREQALNQLKGVPSAAKLVDRLRDKGAMEASTADIEKRIFAWTQRKIVIGTFLDEGWPDRLNDLPNPHRPNAIFSYGAVEDLNRPSAAIIARGAIEEGPFEAAQKLVKLLVSRDVWVSVGITTGFDVVAIKLSLGGDLAPMIVASCGLARVEAGMRSHAGKVVKSGGLMTSSLPMDHGPFEHDAREGYLVQTALAKAAVFVDPMPESFEWAALEWALSSGMSVFAISERSLPERVHLIEDAIDMEWVVAAIKHVG